MDSLLFYTLYLFFIIFYFKGTCAILKKMLVCFMRNSYKILFALCLITTGANFTEGSIQQNFMSYQRTTNQFEADNESDAVSSTPDWLARYETDFLARSPANDEDYGSQSGIFIEINQSLDNAFAVLQENLNEAKENLVNDRDLPILGYRFSDPAPINYAEDDSDGISTCWCSEGSESDYDSPMNTYRSESPNSSGTDATQSWASGTDTYKFEINLDLCRSNPASIEHHHDEGVTESSNAFTLLDAQNDARTVTLESMDDLQDILSILRYTESEHSVSPTSSGCISIREIELQFPRNPSNESLISYSDTPDDS